MNTKDPSWIKSSSSGSEATSRIWRKPMRAEKRAIRAGAMRWIAKSPNPEPSAESRTPSSTWSST